MLEIPPIRVNNQLNTFTLVFFKAVVELLIETSSVGISEVADLSEKTIFIGVHKARYYYVSQDSFRRSVKRYDIA